MSRVFRKTELGTAIFSKPDSGLTQAQRGLLIMVDGKRTASQLRKFASSFGNVNALLRELYNAGFIDLDPAYVEHVQRVRSEIAHDSPAQASPFAAETILAPSQRASAVEIAATAPVTPPTPKQSNEKRDLRDLSIFSDSARSSGRAASGSAASMAEAQKFAVQYITDTLGHSGAPLRFAISRASDSSALQQVLEVAANTLGSMKGQAHATEFRTALREILTR